MSTMTTLLIMTVGQTDVQLVVGDARCELSKINCAALHDEIESRAGEWQVVDSPDSKLEKPVESLPTGNFALCSPKLDALLEYVEKNDISLTSALILETRRNAQDFRNEPRFVGKILATRLCNLGIPEVRRFPYLTNQERLEDRDEPRDAVIRREVVNRIDGAVRDCLETLEPDRVLVATTGGFPAVSSLVEDIVLLHAATTSVDLLEVADGAKANPRTRDYAVQRRRTPEPAVSYRARRHVLDLLEKGSLLGAWGAVSHLKGVPGQEWTRVVEWLAQFASSLPLPKDCDLAILSHQRMAVRAALRVELALRAEDIARAVHSTAAFFEAALWDHLLDRFERTGQRQRSLEELRLKTGVPAPAGKKLLRNEEPVDKEKRNCPFEYLENGTYLFFEDGAGRFARDYADSQPLKALHDAVEKVKPLRNDVAHNEPTPELMNVARTRMQTAQLWSHNDTFLSQPLVQDVLKDLGEQCPDQLCINLVSTVRERLLAIP